MNSLREGEENWRRRYRSPSLAETDVVNVCVYSRVVHDEHALNAVPRAGRLSAERQVPSGPFSHVFALRFYQAGVRRLWKHKTKNSTLAEVNAKDPFLLRHKFECQALFLLLFKPMEPLWDKEQGHRKILSWTFACQCHI